MSAIESPDLRIVPLEALMEHEYNDGQRTAPLVRRIEAEGMLKNPPIVTPLDTASLAATSLSGARYVVLDGANRSSALNALGYPHILVQVVPYRLPQTTLSTWHHAVTHIDVERFVSGLYAIEGLEIHPRDLLSARAELARRELLAYILFSNGEVLAARAQQRGLHVHTRLLNALVDTYKLHGRLHRTISENFDETRAIHPDLTALVIFPNYEPAEVLALARDGELLPPGLTRHLIQGRVLRTNYPLSELRAPDSLADKNARLKEWMQQKFARREIRFYGEATYLFDE